ncbi:MAG: SGNH/GDSL hydrolase family protein [Candidatus Auribacterota bacterium]
MRYLNHRFYWSTQEKVEGTYRILFLGDSILLGPGTSYFETLPANTEKHLNQAIYDKNIECVNLCGSGYAIYDEWLEYVRWSYSLQPDMIVLTMSCNDLELYRLPTETLNYWNEDSIFLPYFKAVLKDIQQYVTENNLPFILAYYTYMSSDTHIKAWHIIQNICDQYGIQAVNLSSGKNDTDKEEEKKIYISEVDTHLSAYYSDIAAKRLNDFILNNGVIFNNRISHDDLYKNLLSCASASLKYGCRPEYVFHRLKTLLLCKNNLIPDPNEERFMSFQHEADKYFTENIKLLFFEAYAEVLKSTPETVSYLNSLILTINRISKKLFVLEKNLADETLPYIPYESKKTLNIKILDKITAKLYSWLEDFKVLKERFFTPSNSILEEFSDYRSEISHRMKQASSVTSPFWNDCILHMNHVLHLANQYIRVSTDHQLAFESSSKLINTSQSILEEFLNFFELLESTIELLKLKKMISLSKFDIIEYPVSYCTIELACNMNKGIIRAELSSITPFYRTISDSHYIIGDGIPHTYTFVFPLFTLGKIKILFYGHDDIEFDHMKLYINNDRQITLRKETFHKEDKNMYDSGIIFTTL